MNEQTSDELQTHMMKDMAYKFMVTLAWAIIWFLGLQWFEVLDKDWGTIIKFILGYIGSMYVIDGFMHGRHFMCTHGFANYLRKNSVETKISELHNLLTSREGQLLKDSSILPETERNSTVAMEDVEPEDWAEMTNVLKVLDEEYPEEIVYGILGATLYEYIKHTGVGTITINTDSYELVLKEKITEETE